MGYDDDFGSLFDGLSIEDTLEIDESALFIKIKDILSSILKSTFKGNSERQKIEEKGNRLNFSCPVCGDSKYSDTKKRGNIYYGGLNFKCYNAASQWCATSPHSIVSFLSRCNRLDDFTEAEISFLKDNSSQHAINISHGGSGAPFSHYSHDLLGIDEFAIPRRDIMNAIEVNMGKRGQRIRLVNVENNIKIFQYLRGRLQVPKNGEMEHFAYDVMNDNLYMFNMTPSKKIIGIQYRVQKPKRGAPRFMTMKYSDIWKWMFNIEVKQELKDQIDKFSYLYNIMNINYNNNVFIFESIMDSHHVNNSVAICSSGTKLYLENGKYLYDNSKEDDAGNEAAMHMLEKGHSVFLWGKFLDDYPEYRYCKDLNDVFRKQPISQDTLLDYFSDDPVDIVYL